MNARSVIEAESPKRALRAAIVAQRTASRVGYRDFGRGGGFYIEVAASLRHGAAHDLGEGPWDTQEDAQEFFNNEVGVTSRIVSVSDRGVKHPATMWMAP